MQTVSFSRRLGLFGLAALAAMVVSAPRVGQAAPPPCTSPLDACLDEFSCYSSWVTKNTPAFAPVSVTLSDQFENVTATLRKTKELCAPADMDEEGVVDQATHLVAYLIKNQSPPHIRRGAVRVTNVLEEIRVDTVKPDFLLVPTAKTLVQPGPPPPDPDDHGVDHYKCYKVRVTPGTPLAEHDRKVSSADQFTVPAKLLTLRKPRHLCTPVEKNGEPIKNPQAHLLCYAAKPARGEPKHLQREGLFVNNQLGPLRLNTLKEKEFCVPSVKSLSPSGAFLEASEVF